MLKFKSFIVLLIFCAFSLSISSQAAEYPSKAKINDIYVVHFIVDGLNNATFKHAVQTGVLPNVEKYFLNDGTVFENTITSFPTVSTTNYQSVVSGLFPGSANIPHLERFDRKKKKVLGYLTASNYLAVNSDFSNNHTLTSTDEATKQKPSTIFDLLAGYPTAALHSSFHKGASHVYPNVIPLRAAWSILVAGHPEKADRLALQDLDKLFAADLGKIPRYSLVGLLGTDIAEHKHGVNSKEVIATLKHFDDYLASFLAKLKQRKLFDKTYVIISADHGSHDTGMLFNLPQALYKAGVKVKPKNPMKKDYTLYVGDRGTSSNQLYVSSTNNPKEAWQPLMNANKLRDLPTRQGESIDLIDLLLKREEIALVAARDGYDQTKVFGKNSGEGTIRCYTVAGERWCSYEVKNSQNDPLEYLNNPTTAKLCDGVPHSANTWRQAITAKYPDAVIQLSQIFQSAHTGDVFVISADRWNFRSEKLATHGSLHSDDMTIPLLMRGPSLAKSTNGPVRLVDIYPLLLSWFGLDEKAAPHDGINPLLAPKNSNKQAQQLAHLEQFLDGQAPLNKLIDIPGFVKKVNSKIPSSAFAKILPLANKEASHRHKLLEQLRARKQVLLKKLGKVRNSKKKGNYNDELTLVSWELAKTRKKLHHSSNIQHVLLNCRSIKNVDCGKI